MWNAFCPTEEDYAPFLFDRRLQADTQTEAVVVPFGDSPLDHENVGETVYLEILAQATDYVYIFTPYLIIDSEMQTALCTAAKRGVDVRIVTPGIPDKKTAYRLTRSFYPALLAAGVHIYEYTPGFLHAKSFVSDDTVATVGTVNLDFRSLYLHFECGVCLYRTGSVKDVKEDFLKTQALSRPITAKDCKANLLTRLCRNVCRVFAPLM